MVGHPVIYLSLSGEEPRGFVIESNLFYFSLAVGFPFCVPFLVVVHSQAMFHDMHACMNGNGPPSESPAIQPTLKLSEIVEPASVPVPKRLLRTKYDNHSRRIPWDDGSQACRTTDREAACQSYDGAARGLAGHGQGRERTIYGTRGTCVTVSLTVTADHRYRLTFKSCWGLISVFFHDSTVRSLRIGRSNKFGRNRI